IPAERAAFVGADRQERRDIAVDVHEDERIAALRLSLRRSARHLIQPRDRDEPLAAQPRDGGVARREHAQKKNLERVATTRHCGRTAVATAIRCGNSPTLRRVTSFRSAIEITESVLSRRLLT